MGMFDFDAMAQNLQSNIKLGTTEYKEDTRFWKLSKDNEGKGAAIIRLLPDKNLVQFVKQFNYSLNKPHPTTPGKKLWFISTSPDTIGLPCPVKEYYMALMAEGTEEAKAEAKKYSRGTTFITNILVIKDPANPENNGKTFLWKFGTKLLDKFYAWAKPSQTEVDMGSVPMNVWDPVNGHNVTLKIKKNTFSFDYDDTSISPTSGPADKNISDEDTALKYIKAKTVDLDEFLQPEHFESYEAIKVKFNKYIGQETKATQATKKVVEDDLDLIDEPAPVKKAEPKKVINEESDEDDSWLDDLA